MTLRLPDDKALQALLKGSHVKIAGEGVPEVPVRRARPASASPASLHGPARAEQASPRPKPPRMNGTESAWAMILEARKRAGEILWYGFEAISLRLAAGARFRPDFAVIDRDGVLHFDEVKGFFREAAKVRLRVAVDLYPFWRFYAVRKIRKKDGGGWNIEGF